MRFPLPVLLLLLTAVAGCFGGGGGGDEGPKEGDLDVTDSTGGIRGIVVDQSVVPVEGVVVALAGTPLNTTTSASGLFNFTGLEPGDYVVTAGKPGYTSMQTTATVVAGVPDPPVVKLLLERLTTAQPYVDHFKLDGFYECAQAFFFVVDTCDWVPRTAWDVANESGNPPPTPRSALRYYNTQYLDVNEDTFTIVQEAYWTDESVQEFWIMLDASPIDASCDCSDHYSSIVGTNPIYARIDRYKADGSENTEFDTSGGFGNAAGEFPNGKPVAARGFLPPSDEPVCSDLFDPTTCGQNTDPTMWYGLAQNFQFTLITSMFHNYRAPEGWTFESRDQYPVG